MILKRNSSTQPEIVSVMQEMPSAEIREQFPVLMEIKWGYEALPNGLPTERELIYARKLYADLDSLVGRQGIHATTTGDGGRTMYYYVKDAEIVSQSVRTFFDTQPK